MLAAGRRVDPSELRRLARQCEGHGRAWGACWLMVASEALWMAAAQLERGGVVDDGGSAAGRPKNNAPRVFGWAELYERDRDLCRYGADMGRFRGDRVWVVDFMPRAQERAQLRAQRAEQAAVARQAAEDARTGQLGMFG